MAIRRQFMALVVVIVFIATLLDGPCPTWSLQRLLSSSNDAGFFVASPLLNYSQSDLKRTAPLMDRYVPRVLVFDGVRFTLHNLIHESMDNPESYPTGHVCGRGQHAFPLLVDALLTYHMNASAEAGSEPKQHDRPFQVIYVDGDSVHSTLCVNHPNDPKCANLAPILAFASTPTNTEEILPSLRIFPNAYFVKCLYDWRMSSRQDAQCNWKEFRGMEAATRNQAYDELIPTIIWRGSDHMFLEFIDEYRNSNLQRKSLPILDELRKESGKPHDIHKLLLQNMDTFPPRWKGAILSIGAQLDLEKHKPKDSDQVPWIDSKFTGPTLSRVHDIFNNMGVPVSDPPMTPAQMSKYKYQIDYGGGGGTSWQGTLTKMKMPGVLFHHETRMKDWFYDDFIRPWEHYIPVSWDLGDLRERFEWAETHPKECEEMSQRATQVVDYIMSALYMGRLHQDLFNETLGELVESYQSSEEELAVSPGQATLDFILDRYHKDGFITKEVAGCDALGDSCSVLVQPNKYSHARYKPKSKRKLGVLNGASS